MKISLLISFFLLSFCSIVLQAQPKYDEVVEKGFDVSEVRKGKKIGLIRTSTQLALTPLKYEQYSNISGFQDCPFGTLSIKGKYALVDANGKWLTDFVYSDIDMLGFQNNMIPVSKDWKKGILNTKGELVIPCEFDDIIFDISERNEIMLSKNQLWGIYALESNQLILPLKYTDLSWRTVNLLTAINQQGRTTLFRIEKDKAVDLLQDSFEAVVCLMEPYYFIKKESKWALIEGKEHIYSADYIYDEIQYQYTGQYSRYLLAKKDGLWGILYPNGKTLFEPMFMDENIYFDNNGYAEATLPNGKCLIHVDGKIIIQGNYEALRIDDKGKTIRFIKGGKYGLMNLDERIILPNEYDLIGTYLDSWYGLDDFTALVKEDKAGFANQKGEIFTDFVYQYYGCLYDNMEVGWMISPTSYFGLMAVKKEGKWGIIDMDGKVVLPFEYDRIECPEERTGIIEKEGQKGLFDWEIGKIKN